MISGKDMDWEKLKDEGSVPVTRDGEEKNISSRPIKNAMGSLMRTRGDQ